MASQRSLFDQPLINFSPFPTDRKLRPGFTLSSQTHETNTDSLERQSPYCFGKNAFSLSELDYINKAAYWNYPRERIYVRSSKRLQDVLRKDKKPVKTFPINEIIECARPKCCPKCGATTQVFKHRRCSRLVHDLKFGLSGIKRWVVKSHLRRRSRPRDSDHLPQEPRQDVGRLQGAIPIARACSFHHKGKEDVGRTTPLPVGPDR